jgi:hypothetical protein
MNSLAVEKHTREAFILQAHQSAEAVLRNDKVKQALGRDALKLYEISQKLFIPEIEDTYVFCEADYVKSDLVPIVALFPGEDLLVEERSLAMASTQKQSIRAKLNEGSPPDYVDTLDKDMVASIYASGGCTIDIEQDKGGRVTSHLGYGPQLVSGGPEWFVASRPVMAVNMEVDDPDSQAIVMLHEYVHVYQRLYGPLIASDPFKRANDTIAEELVAYALGATIARSLGLKASPDNKGCIATTLWVDEFRREECGMKVIDGSTVAVIPEQRRQQLMGVLGISVDLSESPALQQA